MTTEAPASSAATTTTTQATPEPAKKGCGAGCGDEAAPPSDAPAGSKPPQQPILFKWMGVYWLGMPAPVRWWNPTRWKSDPGCGCILRLKQAWMAVRDFWRPRPWPSRVIITPFGTRVRPMTRKELEASAERTVQRGPRSAAPKLMEKSANVNPNPAPAGSPPVSQTRAGPVSA